MSGEKVLMKGNEALGEGVILAGCQLYAGYPITPQNELTAYMSWRMRQEGRIFIQSESELAAINIVFGAAVAGARAMTSSSSPGISLMQEGISYMAGAELPGVIANVARGGPGLGSIGPAQSDYFQAVKGGGHGDYYCPVLAPSTVQEMMDYCFTAFDLADKYRTPIIILTDGLLGQMSEPVIMREPVTDLPAKPWALTGCEGREPKEIKSLYLDNDQLEEMNRRLQQKYGLIREKERRFELFMADDHDLELLIVAYGSVARVCKSAIITARQHGVKAGLFRPITLFPFPAPELEELSCKAAMILVVEMSCGQMIDDVKLSIGDSRPIFFYGRCGGNVVTPEEICQEVNTIFSHKVITTI